MAKALIATAYGKGPDRSYIGGCSNAGRHTMVAMTRMPGEYDGYLAGAPGYRLPLAAIANMDRLQHIASVATDPADLNSGFTAPERALLSASVVAKCDALDGATDGMIQDVEACRAAFDIQRDVPTCTGARDGTCFTAAQKTAYRADVLRRTRRSRQEVLRHLPVRHRAQRGRLVVLALHRAAVHRLRGDRVHLGRAASRPARPSSPPVYALTVDNDTKLTAVSRDECHVHRVRPVVHASRWSQTNLAHAEATAAPR